MKQLDISNQVSNPAVNNLGGEIFSRHSLFQFKAVKVTNIQGLKTGRMLT